MSNLDALECRGERIELNVVTECTIRRYGDIESEGGGGAGHGLARNQGKSDAFSCSTFLTKR